MGWEKGGKSKEEGIYVYIQLIHFFVEGKLTQHCKTTILQLKKKKRDQKKAHIIFLKKKEKLTNQARKGRKRKRVEKAEMVSQRVSQTAPFEKGVMIPIS